MFFRTVVLGLAAIVVAHAQAPTRQVVDMRGNTLTLPAQIRKIYAPSPYGSYLLHAVAPDLMSGLTFALKEEDKPFLNPAVLNLPVVGGRSGTGMTTNLEVLLKSKPDLILQWGGSRTATSNSNDGVDKFGIPTAHAVVDTMADYPAVFRFMGRLLGREARCEQMASYCQKTLDEVEAVVKGIPQNRRVKVYYAEGLDGLSTECNDSIHVQLLKLAGDCNVHRCHTASHMGLEKISLEQILIYNPDVLVVQEKAFFDRVFTDPAWKRVKAVHEGRVYLIPRVPFNWFDRPPSFMRFLGLKWLMHNLYPKDYPGDIVKESRQFYDLFLGAKVTDADMQKVIYRR